MKQSVVTEFWLCITLQNNECIFCVAEFGKGI